MTNGTDTNHDSKEIYKEGRQPCRMVHALGVSLIWMIGETIVKYGFRIEGITDTAEQDRIFDEVAVKVSGLSGTYMIIGVLAALGFLFLYFRSEQKMTSARFAARSRSKGNTNTA